jgi:hypothetical protein
MLSLEDYRVVIYKILNFPGLRQGLEPSKMGIFLKGRTIDVSSLCGWTFLDRTVSLNLANISSIKRFLRKFWSHGRSWQEKNMPNMWMHER